MKEYLPLRLLDVNDTKHGVVRVLPTETLDGHTRADYCALSHCWGGSLGSQLTKDNLDAAMRGIQTSSLPQTFQDAISATSGLGVRYLWIDSLCIVQDDSAEWEMQSSKMGLVYANARCVISATGSRDSAGGCFRPRRLNHHDCGIWQTVDKVLVACSTQKDQKVKQLFESLVENSPVTRRGWTFQERYLASRMLHFCEGTVLFECCTMQASEGMWQGERYTPKPVVQSTGGSHGSGQTVAVDAEPLPGRNTDSVWKKARSALRGKGQKQKQSKVATVVETKEEEEKRNEAIRAAAARKGMRGALEYLWRFKGKELDEKFEFHNRWFEVVTEYSARQLTIATDKGIAIAGVASVIQQNTGLTYSAGLWKEMLPFNLLWLPSGDPGPRPARRTPSWSWTSVDGRVTHRLRDDWQSLSLLIFGESLERIEMIGDLVHNATLRLRGQLRPLEPDNVHITFDVDASFAVDQLYLLPGLVFRFAASSHAVTFATLHGIVLHERRKSQGCYTRAGYFWSDHPTVVNRVWNSRQDTWEIEIV